MPTRICRRRRVCFVVGALLASHAFADPKARPNPTAPDSGVLVSPHEMASYQREVPTARSGMVVSATALASDVGAEVLRAGGNAADAAVATALALAVTWPEAGNLGGGGFCLTKMPGRPVEALDHREVAPRAASKDMYLGASGELVPEASTVGFKAVAVPGSPAGLEALHKRYGSLEWKTLVEPSIKLAKEGVPVDGALHRSILRSKDKLARFEASSAIFLGASGEPPSIGSRLVQSDLASVLEAMARQGAKGFHDGPVAEAIETAMREGGGLITKADLETYTPVWREPVSTAFAGLRVYSMPPPSSGGGTLIAMLQTLEALGTDRFAKGSAWNAQEIDWLAQTMSFAFRDRAEFYGDPDFNVLPLEMLLSRESAQWAASRIREREAGTVIPSKEVLTYTLSKGLKTKQRPPGEEKTDGNTTHFSVADGKGGWVSCTTTLNSAFGSGAVAPRTGVVLNNEMDDFTSQMGQPNLYGLIQGAANAIEPGKRPLSSMTPTLVTRLKGSEGLRSAGGEEEVIAALGTPGGPTIITQVLQLILGLFVKELDPAFVVAMPRFHHQWQPDVVFMEPAVFSSDTIDVLLSMGHNVTLRSGSMGAAHIIVKRNGLFEGGADPRLAGAVAFP